MPIRNRPRSCIERGKAKPSRSKNLILFAENILVFIGKRIKNSKTMANHKSSEKRIRQTATKRAHNRLYHKTTRNAVKALRNTSEKGAAEALLPKVTAMLDKLAKHNIIHKNKAANLKSAAQLHVNAL